MILRPTLTEIKNGVAAEHFPHMVFHRAMAIRFVKNHDHHLRRQERQEVARWCMERWGMPAQQGRPLNPDDPGFYKGAKFVNPDVARVEFHTEMQWTPVNFRYFFKDPTAAIEFKLRWR